MVQGFQRRARAPKHVAPPRQGNDAGMKGVSVPIQANDASIKAKVASMPAVRPQGNDVGMGDCDDAA
jgi:hypothetical protein